MKLTLGPLAYHWPNERKRDFYARIADEAPIDTVYLGEVICSKRAPFVEEILPEIIERLQQAGKTVVISTLAEVVLDRERQATRELVSDLALDVEINNVAGLAQRGRNAHRVGPFLNAYNEASIAWLAGQGATHVCLPTELPGKSIAIAAPAARVLGLGVEVQVFGRAPLATSSRCYHARAHNRTKDTCRFVCEEDADGMPLTTGDGAAILRINGIQTQSERYVVLCEELALMKAMGVTHARLLPQDVDMVAVAKTFEALLRGEQSSSWVRARLTEICTNRQFSNGFFHGVAGLKFIEAGSAAQGVTV